MLVNRDRFRFFRVSQDHFTVANDSIRVFMLGFDKELTSQMVVFQPRLISELDVIFVIVHFLLGEPQLFLLGVDVQFGVRLLAMARVGIVPINGTLGSTAGYSTLNTSVHVPSRVPRLILLLFDLYRRHTSWVLVADPEITDEIKRPQVLLQSVCFYNLVFFFEAGQVTRTELRVVNVVLGRIKGDVLKDLLLCQLDVVHDFGNVYYIFFKPGVGMFTIL